MPKPKEIPPVKAPLVGGPFDGRVGYFTPENWTPDEVRYRKFHEEGIIEDLRMFSINFPEGARYRWNQEERNWSYIGKLDEDGQEDRNKLFRAFGLEPEHPL